MTAHFHTLTVGEVRPETNAAMCVQFIVPPELEAAFRYTQGQHITLRATVGGEELRRSYSICAPVAAGTLRIAIKRVPGGKFSAYAHENLHAGAQVEVMTPAGRFFTALDPRQRKTYLALAAGSGITPVISILGSVLRTEPQSRCALVYGNRDVNSIMFREELEDLKDRYLDRFALYHVLSREAQEAALFTGRIDGAKCRELFETLLPPAHMDEVFLCGPYSMIDEATQALRAAGFAPEHIHSERFGVPVENAAEPAPAPAGESPADEPAATSARAQVTLIVDGVKRQIGVPRHGTSILESALKAGIELPYSCKGGMCCTCRARLVSGKVRMDRNYSLEAGELAKGFVLTCQSHPETDAVTLDYDQR